MLHERLPAAYVPSNRRRSTFLPFGAPSLGARETGAATQVLASGWIGQGPRCSEFERALARYVGAGVGVFVNSCTSALHLSLLAAGVAPGDEVITTPLTFAGALGPIEWCGARVVLADVDPGTLNLAPSNVAMVLGPRTKAVVAVHFGGRALDLAGFRRVLPPGVALIEDAAHAVGGRDADGRPIGASGNLVCFSFYPNKNITTIEGGMVMTPDPRVAETLRAMRLHGFSSDAWQRYAKNGPAHSRVTMPGFKYNATDVNAAVGLVQLARLEEFLARREELAQFYDAELLDVSEVEVVARPHGTAERHALHLYLVRLDLGRLRCDRDDIVAALRAENIGAGVHYEPVFAQPYYRERYGWRAAEFPAAAHAGARLLTLPLSPSMSDGDAQSVVTALRRVIAHYRA